MKNKQRDQKIKQIRAELKNLLFEITVEQAERDYNDKDNNDYIEELYVKIEKLAIEGNKIKPDSFDTIGNFYPFTVYDLGDIVEEEILKADSTFSDFAELAGLSETQLMNIRKGRSNYTINSLIRLLNILKKKIVLIDSLEK